jgi:hypothetical protein
MVLIVYIEQRALCNALLYLSAVSIFASELLQCVMLCCVAAIGIRY